MRQTLRWVADPQMSGQITAEIDRVGIDGVGGEGGIPRFTLASSPNFAFNTKSI